MKILSIAVPCYNSEAYMKKCIESLLVAGDKIEILIVNDGSKDRTAEIANAYEKKYPNIIRAIHQENAGHGGAVNTGIKNAAGRYFKVIDSDDWVDKKAFMKVIDTLEHQYEIGDEIDLLITNFVYNKQGVKRHKVMRYATALPQNRVFTWNDKIHIRKTQYILMHSVTYKTEILRRSGVKLPEHTFYVDNVFLYTPLPYTKKLYYLDVNLYQYFIGREDQSVNEKVMISRIDQQIRVNQLLIKIYGKADKQPKNMHKYMLQYMDMMMCVASVMLILSKTEEGMEKKKALWNYLKVKDPVLYRKMRTTLFGIWMNLPGRAGRWLSVTGYKVMQKIFGFN